MDKSQILGVINPVDRDDWDGINDECPECGGTRYESTNYDTTIFEDGTDVNDRWAKAGNLFVECLECGEILHKHPAYDVLKAIETEENTQQNND